MKVPRKIRQVWHLIERSWPFFVVAFSSRGIISRDGRQLIRGKLRRAIQSLNPAYARRLQIKHGMTGGCVSCGASCNLLIQCPHWDAQTHLCTVYEDRPSICRTFPITPKDIADRNLVIKDKSCGFKFAPKAKP